MANGYFERGEIYNIRMDNGVGSEEGSYRPGVIVSNSKLNSSFGGVMIAYLTTRYTKVDCTMETMATGRRSYIMFNQIATVDKSRLRPTPMGVLTSSELRDMDDILEDVFDLGYNDSPALAEKDKEIEELKVKIAELTGEVAREQARVIELQAKHEDELLSYKVENTMWQKCYDKVLTQLVDMKCMNDTIRRVEPKFPVVVEVPKVPVQPKVIDPEEPVLNVPIEPVEVKDDRIDINHCTRTQLKKVGMSDALARAVIAKRPFNSVGDLKNVPGMNGKKYQIFEPKLTCTPLEIIELTVVEPEVVETQDTTEKLNINAVSARELHEKTGLALSTAYFVTGYRKANGPYEKLEDILNANQVYPATLDKIRDKIMCGPGIEETPGVKPKNREYNFEPYTGEKININLATAEEINKKTGLSLTVCYSITGCRKRDGKYRAVSDLENVPRFTAYHMAKFGPMFEV